jgi:protein-tyrosine phosphatase
MSESVFWINSDSPGKLAIAARPRGDDWLEDDILNLKKVGVDVIVCLLEEDELQELGLAQEEPLCKSNGVTFISFPIQDYFVPESVSRTKEVCLELSEYLNQGKSVVIHCRQGIGRSSIIAAVVLKSMGMTINDALEKISKARKLPVPETAQQKSWLEKNFG